MTRSALEAVTLCEAFQITAADRPPEAVAHRSLGGLVEITWGEYARRVEALAGGLHAMGLRRGDTLAMMLVNRPEFNLVDTAAMHLGATPFSVYNTLTAEQVAFQLENSDASIVVTESQFLPTVLAARTSTVEHVVLVDGDEDGTTPLAAVAAAARSDFDFDAAWRAVEASDILTLIYTSGTTGNPKGVELTHANLLAENRAVASVLPTKPGGKAISYLPSAHLADRWMSHYFPSLCFGATVTSVADPRQIGAALTEVRPTNFVAVPRIWEKLKAALEAGGISDPAALDESTKTAIRSKLGLDEAEWHLSGAAPIPAEVLQFFLDLGIPICEVWGMSELSAITTINPPGDIRIGTVGRALPGMELRLLDDGELLARGPLVMKGYRNDPQRTAEAVDQDGWMHTGDVATIDVDGYVRIVDRKKELIINAAGKNMSPANIEQRLKAASPLIGQAVCIGDARPYNTALLVLDPDTSAQWASEREIAADPGSLSQHDELRAAITEAVSDANSHLARVEQIRRFEILGTDWLPGGIQLTPTSKLKRKAIHEEYAEIIDQLYAG